MFKNSFVGLCVLLILLQSGISAFYTVSKLKHHKREIKKDLTEQLNSGVLNPNIVVFSSDELTNAQWEHSKEFFLGKDKYDVLKVVTENNSTKWYCIKDNEELILLKSLSDKENNKVNFEDVIKKIQLTEFSVYIGITTLSKVDNQYASMSDSTYTFLFKSDNFRPPLV